MLVHDGAVEGGVRILQRIFCGVAARCGLRPEAVGVGAVAETEVVVLASHRPCVPPLVDEPTLLGLFVRCVELSGVQGDKSAECVDPLVQARVAPAVTGNDAGVVRSFENIESRFGGLDAHVIDVHDHPSVHQTSDRVRAEVGQAVRIALRTRGVHRKRHSGWEYREKILCAVDLGGQHIVLGNAGAWFRLPELPGAQVVADVDGHSGDAAVETGTAEGVVELVRDDHLPDTEVVQLVQAAVDVVLGALRNTVAHRATEGFGHLHPEGDGQLSVGGHLPGLFRRAHDAEPTPAGTAVLGVDVVLEFACLLRLDPDGLHLVTGISLARIQLAQDTIGDKEIGEDSQPAAPGPLDPLVVRLLVRQ
ncbi:SpoIIE family protein phosphatase [Rhodococcus qingshengii]|nr:SpoIIE family protein phosphatase [Rhodococcus qingshengii]